MAGWVLSIFLVIDIAAVIIIKITIMMINMIRFSWSYSSLIIFLERSKAGSDHKGVSYQSTVGKFPQNSS